MTRRVFLARAVAAGLAIPAGAGLLEACLAASPATPSPATPASTPPAGSLPELFPTPLQAAYGDMAPFETLTCESCPSGALGVLLAEVAATAGVALNVNGATGPAVARLAVDTTAHDLPPQGYRLAIAAGAASAGGGIAIDISSSDEPGAYYGLVSLGQLIVAADAGHAIRTADVTDSPSFARRGFILDMPLPASDTDREALLERVRLGAAHKMNFLWPANGALDVPSTAREVVAYCDSHYIELMLSVGYGDLLTSIPRASVINYVQTFYDRGIRSFSFNWDDIHNAPDAQALADAHAAVLDDVVAFVGTLRDDVRLRVTLPPYGGVPGENLMGIELYDVNDGTGEAYLAAIRDHIPPATEVFWTGDGGIFSTTVTADGARAYADALGRPIGLWDNSVSAPSRGRAADLPTIVQTYMGNMAGSHRRANSDAPLALLTALDYTWNAGAYEPDRSAQLARHRLQ